MSISTKPRSNVSVVCALAFVVAGTLPACSDNTVVDVPDTGPAIDTGPGVDGALPDSGVHDTGVHDTGVVVDANLPDTNADAFVAPDAFGGDDGGSDAGPPPCGNGVVDSGETCDTAIASGAGACPTSCNDSVACTTDAMTGSMCTVACTHTPLTASGTTVDMCCPSGATHTTDVDCPATCGNGTLDTGETCDTMITSGVGVCPTMASCNDSMACTTDALVSGGTCNAMCTHTAITAPSGTTVDMCCPPAANHNTDADCAAVCGNSVIEGPGETCDPPVTGSCDAACHIIASCGDGVLQAGEDCDDSNHRNLDGCDSACHYEMVTRLTSLAISGTAAPMALGCTPSTNQLGARAITGTALGQLNPQLATSINNGVTNILIQAFGMTDLSGATDPAIMLGVIDASTDPAAGTYPMGTNPIDWRFLVDPNSVSTMGLPVALMAGSITARNLRGGPTTITIPLALGGAPANMVLGSVHVAGTVNGTPAPNHPTYPASLRASLTTFQTITANGTGQGLCGNVSVQSLAQIPVPAALTSGTGNCSQGYTPCTGAVNASCNSLLDVLVHGCTVLGGLVTVINPTQPDVAGGTTVTPLMATGTLHKVTLPAGDTDAYSGYFTFTANRAHASGETCATATQCQTGQACTSGVCH